MVGPDLSRTIPLYLISTQGGRRELQPSNRASLGGECSIIAGERSWAQSKNKFNAESEDRGYVGDLRRTYQDADRI